MALSLAFTIVTVAVIPALIGVPRWLGRSPGSGGGGPATPVPEGELPVTVALPGGGTVVLPLEDYVRGVVAAEMPASFHPEALRAQAVAARTYAVRHMRVFGGGGCPGRPEADVCGAAAEGQAWLPEAELRRRWGLLRFPVWWRKVSAAVEATRGLIVVYDQEPIDAVFHAAAGGRTEDARYVWGRAVPYLRSVDSPDRGTRYDGVRVAFTLEEVARRTGVEPGALARAAVPVAVEERTPSGRAAAVRVGDRRLTGREFRQALGLNSTLFTLRLSGGRLEVTTSGYGHGAGLSQYGADALARAGRDFRAILAHYYPGTQVRPIFQE